VVHAATIRCMCARHDCGCAVGPKFLSPPAPDDAGYTPGGQLAATAFTKGAGGDAQRFAIGRDIPGDWWRLFKSRREPGRTRARKQAEP
jgi:hypothetical protein